MSLPVEVESSRERIVEEIAKLGAELLEIQFRRVGQKSTITFVVDKPGGITLDDCVVVNRALSRLFDEMTELIQGSYYLEVNSPGLDRPLKNQKDFARSLGKKVKAVWRVDSGRTETATGEVLSADETSVRIVDEKGEKTIAYAQLVKATKEISFKR